jgi:hypothetical protein
MERKKGDKFGPYEIVRSIAAALIDPGFVKLPNRRRFR